MTAPERITAPAELPITLEEAKAHLRIDHADEDALIEIYMAAAVEHMDGWAGVLGKAMVSQTWQQGFPNFRRMELLVGPVARVTAVEWTAPNGTVIEGDASSFSLVRRMGGRTFACTSMTAAFAPQEDAVRVSYEAGAQVEGVSSAMKVATLILVKHYYDERGTDDVPESFKSIIAPVRNRRL